MVIKDTSLESKTGQLICGALGCRQPIAQDRMIYSPNFGQLYHLTFKCFDSARLLEAAVSGMFSLPDIGSYYTVTQ